MIRPVETNQKKLVNIALMKKDILLLLGLVLMAWFFTIGINRNSFEVTSFNAITNNEFGKEDTIVMIEADLDDAPLHGIRIPSAKQCKGGKIAFNFTVSKSGNTKLYYKLFYQNVSYKFPENHPYNTENFYGSWESDSLGFKPLPLSDEDITVNDSLVITGNPRNENKYFGIDPEFSRIDEKELENETDYIKEDTAWYRQIIEKSKAAKRTVEEQLKQDAVWSINEKRKSDKSVNNRLWRNPRMGTYEFMLVVVSEKALKKVPTECQQINLTDPQGNFRNPFSYFARDKDSLPENILILKAQRKLVASAKFNLGNGIYVDNKDVGKEHFNKDYYSRTCGDRDELYRRAHFQQYFHYINQGFSLKNIPEIIDVMDPSFTLEKYKELKEEYERTKRTVDTYVNSSDCPCKTVKSDSVSKSITIVNPGNKPGEHKKEHVGVYGRIGFTYGKWRAKIKFPELINKENVWVGLTNAFWLLAQDTYQPWNYRRECKHEFAYIPKSMPDEEASLWKTQKQNGYSEIDFEILKESQYWPASSYPKGAKVPTEDPEMLDDITVTCTNWDLACHEPKKFDIGAKANVIDGMEFVHHRWNPWYKALTTKVAVKNAEVVNNDYYYFEIDWQPTKIIWRIGPSKDKMKVICIMDETVSAIPNNQMIPVITQEWHSQEWWPKAPFKQNFVPFPKKDIVGKILEVEVE